MELFTSTGVVLPLATACRALPEISGHEVTAAPLANCSAAVCASRTRKRPAAGSAGLPDASRTVFHGTIEGTLGPAERLPS